MRSTILCPICLREFGISCLLGGIQRVEAEFSLGSQIRR